MPPSCPHCSLITLKKCEETGETQRYRYKHCTKTFNIKTNTPLGMLRKCHLREEYIRCMKLKLTLRQAVSICHVNLKTVFFGDTVLTDKTAKSQDKLSGIIEVDEFFLALSEKSSKKI